MLFAGSSLCGLRFLLSSSLSCGLEHDDGSCCGYVERRDGSGHGDAQQVIAGAADEVVQSVAFATEDDYRVGREIVVVVTVGAALVESDAPDVLLLELLEGAHEIDDTGDADVLGGSGGGFDGDGAEGRGAAFGEKHAVHSGGIGGAEERAEVLRVFDAVECEQESGLVTGEQVFKVEKLPRADYRHDSLVAGGLCQTGKLFFGFEAEADAAFAACVDDLLQPLVVPLPGDAYVVELPASGAQSLFNGVQAVQNLHQFSLTGVASEYASAS